ncbi:MAG: response regulator [Alphaproteobacteria bacterium]|nr:response regulator [Alphaproteobacteria bacterium]
MSSDFNTPEHQTEDQTNSEPAEGSDVDLSKVTALVVEDENVISEVMCALLKKIGIGERIPVRTAEDALGFVEDSDANIGIALVDLMLPGASGLAFIKTVREHKKKRIRELPIVVVTSYTSMKVYKKAAEFNINGFLRKPVAPGALESAVIKALGGKISVKAMQTYREEALALHGESGTKKKAGFFATLFGTDIPERKQPAQKPTQRKAPAPKKTRPPGVKLNRNA